MTTPKQRNERLLQVCRVLRELPKEKRFSLNGWYRCGTIACATGWAAVDPWFMRRGLKLNNGWAGYYPVYKLAEGFSAIRLFFGINCETAYVLFSSDNYKRGTRRDVIRRIEKFVRDNPA